MRRDGFVRILGSGFVGSGSHQKRNEIARLIHLDRQTWPELNDSWNLAHIGRIHMVELSPPSPAYLWNMESADVLEGAMSLGRLYSA
jgi:hypothetical protein